MRPTLLRYVLGLVIFTAAAMLISTLIASHNTVQELSGELIQSRIVSVEGELSEYLRPVTSTLQVNAGWVRQDTLRMEDPSDLIRLITPILANHTQISAFIMARENGDSLVLFQEGENWRLQTSRPDLWQDRVQVQRWRDDAGPAQAVEERSSFDASTRPWFRAAMAAEPGEVVWSGPYTFFSSKEAGMTASLRVLTDSGENIVLALDVLLLDISRFTSQLQVSPNGLAMVLSRDNLTLGLPRNPKFIDDDALRRWTLTRVDELGINILREAVNHLDSLAADEEQHSKFTSGGQNWWAGSRFFPLAEGQAARIVVLVPEEDLISHVYRQRNIVLLVTLGALALGLLVVFYLDRKFRKGLGQAVNAARSVGQYQLLEKIGEGAVGAVYRARHAMLRRPTAIKLLRTEQLSSSGALSRFEREAQMTSRLTHPHTIILFDYGRTPDGLCYYAMEYLGGLDLETLVARSGPLPAARVIYLLEQICGSLQEAHEIGLVHRDVKPANIMLTPRAGDPDFVKVLDFGLVKDLGTREDSSLTNVQNLIGTPLYLAPEAITDPENVGPGADLYAVAATGYFMLTGRPVFEGETPVEVCAKHLHDAPVPPSRLLGETLDPDLEAALLGCLAKSPEDRPASAGALLDQLRACAGHGHWGPEQARAWWQAHGPRIGASTHPEHGSGETQASGHRLLAVDLRNRALKRSHTQAKLRSTASGG